MSDKQYPGQAGVWKQAKKEKRDRASGKTLERFLKELGKFEAMSRKNGRKFIAKSTARKHTWGSIFRNSVGRGDDHGYAAFLADQWEQRQKKRPKP